MKKDIGDIVGNAVTGHYAKQFAELLKDENFVRANILRNWDAEKIKTFALHLLGDNCQKCGGILQVNLEEFDRKLIAQFLEKHYVTFQEFLSDNEIDESEAEQILNKLEGK